MLAACDAKSEAKPPAPSASPSAAPAPSAAAADSLDGILTGQGIDLKGLDEGQKRWLGELVEKYQSPCGKPHSLLTSLKTDPKCKRSIFAARYLANLLRSGLLKSEAEEYYETRFVTPETAKCDLTGVPVRGAPNAPVSLCEFSDFQCPHCKLMEPLLARLLEDFRGQVKLYYKNFPLSKLHPDARDAAAAAVAAGNQGKFWQMHDTLFNHQDSLSAADLEKYATELKLDLKRWKADLVAAREQVDRDRAEGEKFEIAGTPTLYINGRKFKQAGPLRYEDLKDWVEEELSR
ncbi:MAG TPA: thioredoxin domain-containing protein [Polyangia bacterium]|nr:thioredoxin domain-containing protein [Polyangia bacterium]